MSQQRERREIRGGPRPRHFGWVLIGALSVWPAASFGQQVVTNPTPTAPTTPTATQTAAPTATQTTPATPTAATTTPAQAAPVAAPAAAPAAPAVSPAPATPTVGAGPAANVSPVIMLRDIDREMTTLSNDITQSHARLQQITSMVLEQSGGGAQLIIDHQNEMGTTFRLMRATYTLDGATIATRVDDNGSLADLSSFAVYNGRVVSGEHSLTVSLEYQGNGYGIFSYIRGYTFRARSVQTFTVPEGRALRLVVVGYERGGATTAVEDRPTIRLTQTVMTFGEAQTMTSRANAAPTPASAAAPPPAGGAAAPGAAP